MKIEDLLESETEKYTPSKAPPAHGELVTTAQAAKICGCSMGYIRQLKMDGKLRATENPGPGQRDSRYKKSEVERVCGGDKKGKDKE
jgi:hypothetical protein